MVLSEEFRILEICLVSPMNRNSVLEELRVRNLLKRILKVSNAGVEVKRVKRERVECHLHSGNGLWKDKSTERSGVHYEE